MPWGTVLIWPVSRSRKGLVQQARLCTSTGQRCRGRATCGKRGRGPTEGWEGILWGWCPQMTGWPFRTHMSSSVTHLTYSCWLMSWEWTPLGTFPTATSATQGILKPRIRRTRGSGCNPNSENISLLRALNPDSDMGTTLETISKNVWLDSNYINFNRWVKENCIPLRFLKKYFASPF